MGRMLKWHENVSPEIAIAVKRPPKSLGHHCTGFLGLSTGPPISLLIDLKITTPQRKTTHKTLRTEVNLSALRLFSNVIGKMIIMGMVRMTIFFDQKE